MLGMCSLSFHFQTFYFAYILKFDCVLLFVNVKFSTLNMTSFYSSWVSEVLGDK
jgi:hypothetical protein